MNPGFPSVSLPTDHPRPLGQSINQKVVQASVDCQLNQDTCLAIARLSLLDHRPSPFNLLLTTFLICLHRHTAETDLLVTTSSPSADHPDPLPLRITLDPNQSFSSLLQAITILQSQPQVDHVPFDQILNSINQNQPNPLVSNYAPLFRLRFLEANDPTRPDFIHSTALITDLTIIVKSINQPHPPQTGLPSSRQPLAPSVLSLNILYNSLLFSSTRIQAIVEQLSVILAQASVNPNLAINTIPLLGPLQESYLPNPSQDLHWTQWPGPITQIFASNSDRHPNKPCVIEHSDDLSVLTTQDSQSQPLQRTFTYSQIHHASNVLAHHLIKHDILPEQVVTIYSTRGVDLVIAILGILKAGATFSVIDPAYPPQRQKIYLQVSKPSGLIILKRAGKLSPDVKDFIKSDLNVKVTVPALALQHDASLKGGCMGDGLDVLHDSQCLGPNLPSVKIGPDSIGTLSFTSGSTGIPKGVQGRHFSLTHFFPWMAQQFNMDHNSKFTMLSGIAHDPIQRDIFTPLFLGAELHIPTAEDIGTPGRLAEWMAEHQVTVTHLTPAMGQLLSAQASTQVPYLKNAFFVGDVLTKRDCSRLQHIAPNVDIINMFGTTETQRAVSYHLIPSIFKDPIYLETKKDIIPAGKGMQDVQLLVVNRVEKNIQCGIGELGEIYVRSSGLAEGYLGPPEMSAEKFMLNWFHTLPPDQLSTELEMGGKWLGSRDRLYKTGDLGRYLPDGTVECVGRADDQVKIRGFRIELGEIDTHLSQHPSIRENVTLVRRDKDEEKILVTYFVPMQSQLDSSQVPISSSELEDEDDQVSEVEKGIRKYRKLIKNIREYLKAKVPSYSIPTLFVPLVRMPLNPNGKIDKPALPFPDTALQPSSRAKKTVKSDELSPTEMAIQSIWKALLPNNIYSKSPVIPPNESFFDLGGHSILATRMVFEIRKTLSVKIPLGLVFEYPTISSLAQQVDLCSNNDFGLVREEDDRSNSESAHQQSGSNSTAPTQLNSSAFDYAADAKALMKTLKNEYSPPLTSNGKKTILLTGATGFLGVFILQELLNRVYQIEVVICHLRAKTKEAGLIRLRESCQSRGVWNEEWLTENRIEVVLGDLESRQIGVGNEAWKSLSERVDGVIHNGALVHWVYPYSKLRTANVMATLTLMELVGTGKPKSFTFVSSTAVLEKDHYVSLSDALIQRGEKGIPEADDLEASANGLTTGYGQTKWVSERLISEAGRRGMQGAIIRPAYILGDTRTGVSNTDDFLWRLVKGCVQIGSIPDIHNTINMLPVNHVANCVVLGSLVGHTQEGRMKVYHLTARPLPRFGAFLDTLAQYGYAVVKEDYLAWRVRLEQSVLRNQPEDNALFPLLHFVLSDLPSSTKSAELDDRNTARLLRLQQPTSIRDIDLATYLAWLVLVGFLPPPPSRDASLKLLPSVSVDDHMKKLSGRTGR